MVSPAQFLNPEDYIQEGANPGAGALLLACTVGEDYDNPRNRVLVIRGNQWLEFGASGVSLISIDADADGRAYVLSENGTAIEFDWNRPTTRDQLKASRRLLPNRNASVRGPLRRVRILGGEVFTAGSRGQVYRLRGEVFEQLPLLSVDGADLTIEDLSGSGISDLLAVTTDGFAARFDGKDWEILDLPCSAGLNRICALESGE